jgi:hypothetical protein
MGKPAFDLAKLLQPIELDDFFRQAWEKKPLAVCRNQPDYYHGLLSLRDIDEVIAFTRPKFLQASDFQPDTPLPATFVKGWLADDQRFAAEYYPEVSDVQAAFSCGKTVIITSMQVRWAPTAVLCRNLETFFGCPVHANLYLTPRGAQGFNVHHDGHEVFVLQVEGTKHWRFYGPARELPLADEDGPVSRKGLGPPTQEVSVQPGDLLYMPRGHVHEAFTSEGLSMHLTVGVRVHRWVDVLRLALDALSRRDVRFRESVPPGVLGTGPGGEEAAERVSELLRVLAEDVRPREAIDRLGSTFVRGLAPLPGAYFSAGQDAERVGPDTLLEKAPGVVCRVMREDGWAAIEFPGNRVDGPAKIASALQFIVRTPRFAARALPDDLTLDGKLTLVRRLVRARLLQVAESGPSRARSAAE